jgi:hypothetical protein
VCAFAYLVRFVAQAHVAVDVSGAALEDDEQSASVSAALATSNPSDAITAELEDEEQAAGHLAEHSIFHRVITGALVSSSRVLILMKLGYCSIVHCSC